MELKNKTITVIGAAKSGIAVANVVLNLGGKPKITDTKPLIEIETALKGLSDRSKTSIEAGGHTKDFVLASDLIVVSPGVWREAEVLKWAREKGIPVIGEIEFAWQFCKKPVIAVTGSNGKTTTVSLIAKVLEAAGKKVELCGNVGTPFSQMVLSENVDYFVVEVSSFQLELIDTFCPYISVFLNFNQNHLDRHSDMQDYFNTKKRIFMNQGNVDYAVLNAKDEMVCRLKVELKSQMRLFNKGNEQFNPNQLAVLEVSRIVGVADAITFEVFKKFPGVEHRMEIVRKLNGVEYINDSKATTVESGRWALGSVSAPIIMICGGGEKNLEYNDLRDLVKSKVKKMIVLTQEDGVRKKLHRTFEGVIPLEDHDDMREAINSAYMQAVSGDKVLLSPMFTSYDMFNNFEERGKTFKEIVNGL